MKWAFSNFCGLSKNAPYAKHRKSSARLAFVLRQSSGFTIVELLVVIVVIGILAAITVISYTGISQKAVASSLQSDLSGASNLLKMYYTDYGSYPTSLTSNCPTAPVSDPRYCLKPSSNNIFTYNPGVGSSPSTFILTATNNTTNYTITNNSQPIAQAPLSPVADWLAVMQGDHYGSFYDLVSKQYATVTRATARTVYDSATQRIYDVPAGYLGINLRSDGKSGNEAVIEEARTNYLLNSTFTNQAALDTWLTEPGITATLMDTTNIYLSAKEVTLTADGTARKLYRQPVFTSGTATISVYVRLTSGAAPTSSDIRMVVDASAYVPTITAVPGSNWYRATYTGAATSGWNQGIRVEANKSIVICLPQFELGSFATSYIPTTSATAPRNADVITIPTTNWSAGAGTYMVLAGPTNAVGKNADIIDWVEAGGNNRLTMYRPSATLSRYSGRLRAAGGTTLYPTSGSVVGYTVGTVKWATGVTDVALIDGGSSSSDAGGLPSDPTGLPAIATIGVYNGPIQRIGVYASALSGADIVTVTNTIKDGP